MTLMYCVNVYKSHNFVVQSDVNECEGENFPCADNAECQDTEGSFECSCLSGYSGDGYINCTGW